MPPPAHGRMAVAAISTRRGAQSQRVCRELSAPCAAHATGVAHPPTLTLPGRYFDFLPVELATLSLGQAVNWTSQCFGSVVATTHVSGGQANVTITGSSPSGLLCSDTLLVITSYRVVKLLTPSALSPVASTTFTLENSEAKDLFAGGFKVLLLPCGVVGSIESVVATVSLFLGDDEAQYQRNMDFLTQRGVWPAATPFNKTVALPADKTLIPSGTYLAIGRLDGLDPTIMWLTGGLTGHSAVAVWEGDTLYVVESTAPDPLGKVYWPCANGYCGIMRTEWSLWNSRAIAADYHVSVLALADPYAAAFDEDAFWKYFATVEGTPYGYVSMVNVFIDTAAPQRNWPQPVTDAIFNMIGYLFSDLTPTTNSTTPGGGVDGYDYLIRAFNKRSNAGCKTFTCVTDWALAHNTSYPVVAAEPEQDSWRYFDNTNRSMVCSVFAASVYKHAIPSSVLPTLQAGEQSPKDNYQMAIFDGSHFTPTNCPGGYFETPHGSYCQIMGQWELQVGEDGFNTIHPYKDMNNHCPAQWTPDPATRYFRCPASTPSCC